jgi:prepilin peptidase dependent protein B
MLNRHSRSPAGNQAAGAFGSRQRGVTLMEALISMALSTIVIIGMVVLMGNSMGTTNRITQMATLNDELRNVMSLVTRDVRRANFSAASVLCYGNASCGNHDRTRQEGVTTAVGDLVVGDGCLVFQLDRAGTGDATNDSKGAFRLIDDGGVGIIQMWVNSDADVPNCGDADDAGGWLAVTDPNIVDIVAFTVDDDDSYEKDIFQEGGESTYTQRQRELDILIEGELVLEQRMGWVAGTDDQMIRRQLQDTIIVRNDYLMPPVPVPAP